MTGQRGVETSTPISIDETGVPALLNCSSISFSSYSNRYVRDCWVGSAISPADQDKLIRVVNVVGHREEADYVRGHDAAVYSRYATTEKGLQLPVYPQQISSPGTLIKTLRQSNGQTVGLTKPIGMLALWQTDLAEDRWVLR